jgi:hypothetical protein
MSESITVDANKHIVGRGTPGQWIAGGATLLTVAAVMWDARSTAARALELANKAVEATAATQAKVDGALIELGSRLGRIEGLLEAIRAEKRGG